MTITDVELLGLWHRACRHELRAIGRQAGKGRKEQTIAAGCCRGSGIYMSLPELEATLLPLITATTSLHLFLPSAVEHPLQGASSLFSPTFVRPFVNLPSFSSTHSTLPTLQPPFTSSSLPQTRRRRRPLSFVLSVPSSLASHTRHFCISTAFQSLCAPVGLPSATLIIINETILSRDDQQDAYRSVVGPSRGSGLAATCSFPAPRVSLLNVAHLIVLAGSLCHASTSTWPSEQTLTALLLQRHRNLCSRDGFHHRRSTSPFHCVRHHRHEHG